jgi:hypothetical protein
MTRGIKKTINKRKTAATTAAATTAAATMAVGKKVAATTAAATTAAAKTAAATTAVVTKAAAASAARQSSIGSFLQKAATPTKRISDFGDRLKEEQDEEAIWQQELRSSIAEAASLTKQQVEAVMEVVLKAFKSRVVEVARKAAKLAVMEEQEIRKSSSSIVIHRADQWVGKDEGQLNLNLAERVTMAVHRLTAGSVAVMDAFTLGRWDSANRPTAVMVTLGSRAQKATFFKVLAKKASQGEPKVKAISCRDVFPKQYLQEAKGLARKGGELKAGGGIAAFRVIARGDGCIPVLEIKGWAGDGRKETRWRVHQEQGPPQGEFGACGWQEKPPDGAGEARRPSTPRKPAGSTDRLSVSRPLGFPDL